MTSVIRISDFRRSHLDGPWSDPEPNPDAPSVKIIVTEHSHAADRAVAMARTGEVEALMKGSLHTDELMGAVVDSANGLRTTRRVSHVFVMRRCAKWPIAARSRPTARATGRRRPQ